MVELMICGIVASPFILAVIANKWKDHESCVMRCESCQEPCDETQLKRSRKPVGGMKGEYRNVLRIRQLCTDCRGREKLGVI
jgi:hypothetical protein